MKTKASKSKADALVRISIAWPPFTDKLASALAGMDEDEYLVLSVKNSKRYIQFAAQGASGMRVETTSNNYLLKQEQLNAKQIAALVAIGWCNPTGTHSQSTPERDPDGSPNFFAEFSNPVSYEDVAAFSIKTLTTILRVPHPAWMEYKAFDGKHNEQAMPELGLRAEPSTKNRDSFPRLAKRLLATLVELTGISDLKFDDEGDICLRYGGTMTFVRLVGDPIYVRFYSPILSEVEESAGLFSRLNDINANEPATRFVFQNDVIYAVAEVPVQPYVNALVLQTCQRFCTVVDGMDHLLQAELGGRTSFAESMPSKTRH